MRTRTRAGADARDGRMPATPPGRTGPTARPTGFGSLTPWLLASTAIHAGVLAAVSLASVLLGSRSPSPAGARSGRYGSCPVIRIASSAETRAVPSPEETVADPVMAGLLEQTEALSDLPVEKRVAVLEERARRADRWVRPSSIEEIGRHLGIAAPPPLADEPTDPRDLDGSTLTLLDVRTIGDGRYHVRLADGDGRWADLEVVDPDDEEGWAAAAMAMSMLRSNPRLAAIYERCVGPLLPELAAGLAAKPGEGTVPDGAPGPTAGD